MPALCGVCSLSFATKEERDRHRLIHNVISGGGSCQVCRKSFSGYFPFFDHFKEAHPSEFKAYASVSARSQNKNYQNNSRTRIEEARRLGRLDNIVNMIYSRHTQENEASPIKRRAIEMSSSGTGSAPSSTPVPSGVVADPLPAATPPAVELSDTLQLRPLSVSQPEQSNHSLNPRTLQQQRVRQSHAHCQTDAEANQQQAQHQLAHDHQQQLHELQQLLISSPQVFAKLCEDISQSLQQISGSTPSNPPAIATLADLLPRLPMNFREQSAASAASAVPTAGASPPPAAAHDSATAAGTASTCVDADTSAIDKVAKQWRSCKDPSAVCPLGCPVGTFNSVGQQMRILHQKRYHLDVFYRTTQSLRSKKELEKFMFLNLGDTHSGNGHQRACPHCEGAKRYWTDYADRAELAHHIKQEHGAVFVKMVDKFEEIFNGEAWVSLDLLSVLKKN